MVRKNSDEWKVRNFLEQNSNGGLKIETIIDKLTPLIDKPKWSGGYCIMCKGEKERGYNVRIKKSIHKSKLCQSHMRWAVVTRQNPYDDSFEENYRQVFYRE